MAVVKGSKEYQWTVVKTRPHMRLYRVLGTAVLFLVSVCGAYWVGQERAYNSSTKAQKHVSHLRTELENIRKEEQRLRQLQEHARLGAEVDRKSLEDVRLEVIDLKATVASLEEENRFYRNLMQPEGDQKGLNFGPVEIAQTDRPRTYRYKVVMQQLATQTQTVVGTLTFNVVGRYNGEIKTFPLKELSSSVDGTNIKLRFKYFQNIEGEIVLPDGFEPERIELEARTGTGNSTVIEKRLAWLVQNA